jgi:hypothetical protein
MEETKPAATDPSSVIVSTEQEQKPDSFWDLANFKPLVDYNKPDTELVQAQTHEHMNPELNFVCRVNQSLGLYQGCLNGSICLTRPARQPKEVVVEALDKLLITIKDMVMSSYDEESQLDIQLPGKHGQRSCPSELKFIRFNEEPADLARRPCRWHKWSKDQGFNDQMA